MAAMLSESVLRISGSSERSQQALAEARSHLDQAIDLEDLQKVKTLLGTCLEQVCQESLLQKEEALAAIAEMQRHVEQAEEPIARPPEVDPVTGLPGRSHGETAVCEALHLPGRKYVGVLVLDRLQSINARFGNRIGDQVLAELTRHLKANLMATDSLFRWSGPTLLVVMSRHCTLDRIRIDVKPLFGKSVEREFDVGGRSVLIPVAAAWAVFGLVPPATTILKHIDAFVASQMPKDYL